MQTSVSLHPGKPHQTVASAITTAHQTEEQPMVGVGTMTQKDRGEEGGYTALEIKTVCQAGDTGVGFYRASACWGG